MYVKNRACRQTASRRTSCSTLTSCSSSTSLNAFACAKLHFFVKCNQTVQVHVVEHRIAAHFGCDGSEQFAEHERKLVRRDAVERVDRLFEPVQSRVTRRIGGGLCDEFQPHRVVCTKISLLIDDFVCGATHCRSARRDRYSLKQRYSHHCH